MLLNSFLHTGNIGSSLWLMLMGMVGILLVMAIIMGVVYLLNKFTKDKDEDK